MKLFIHHPGILGRLAYAIWVPTRIVLGIALGLTVTVGLGHVGVLLGWATINTPEAYYLKCFFAGFVGLGFLLVIGVALSLIGICGVGLWINTRALWLWLRWGHDHEGVASDRRRDAINRIVTATARRERHAGQLSPLENEAQGALSKPK